MTTKRAIGSGDRAIVLGAGMTGAAAGFASGVPVFEAAERPGGICASYYADRKDGGLHGRPPEHGDSYRFEVGGGHWIWGGNPAVMRLISTFGGLRSYQRKAAVYFPDQGLMVPYPLQNNLRYLDKDTALSALEDVLQAQSSAGTVRTMADWIRATFGRTLDELFFGPFHELYTAGMWTEVAPQDAAKSPIDLTAVARGAMADVEPAGYNTSFYYPQRGLDAVAAGFADRCNLTYGKQVVSVDLAGKVVHFSDGTDEGYDFVVSTLPLGRMTEMAELRFDDDAHPYTSVMVVNIGGTKGPTSPDVHWAYIPRSDAGFHRVGLYSNVDDAFLPAAVRGRGTHAAFYVEKAYRGGERPSDEEARSLCDSVASELKQWGWIDEVEVIDPTWVEFAYTWGAPGSKWRESALTGLAQHDIVQVGRYARWAGSVTSQGISQSVKDGLAVGGALR